MYYNFLVSFVAETKLLATQGSPRTGQISLSTMLHTNFKTLTTSMHLLLNLCHIPTVLLPPTKVLVDRVEYTEDSEYADTDMDHNQ